MDFFCSKSIYIDNHKRDLNEELALKLYEKLFIFNASIYLLAYYKSICQIETLIKVKSNWNTKSFWKV